MDNIINANNLTKVYGRTKALDSISFDIKRGEIFGVVGPDGAGKTTLSRILSGVINKTSGEILIKGLDIEKNCEKIKHYTGYMSQKFNLYPTLTVKENIDFFAGIFGVKKEVYRDRVPYLLSLTGLSDFTKRQAKDLSGGMKQKLALISTLIHKPEILILDEPTVGVDPVSRRDFWVILQEFSSQGTTIVISSSYMNEAELCNKIILLFNGRIIKEGNPVVLKKIDKAVIELTLLDNKKIDEDIIKRIKLLSDDFVFRGSKIRVMVNLQNKNIILNEFKNKFKIQEISPSIEDVFISSIIN